MNKITFNTGRPVTPEGQVITAAEHNDGTVLFHDHSGERGGRITGTFDRSAGITLREFVVKHYEAGDYVPDAKALKLVRAVVPFGQHEFMPDDERAHREELIGEQFEHDGRPILFRGDRYTHARVNFIVNYHVVGRPSIQYTDLIIECESPIHAMATVIREKGKQGARVQAIFIEPTYRLHMNGYDPVADDLRAGPGWSVDSEGLLSAATFQPHR